MPCQMFVISQPNICVYYVSSCGRVVKALDLKSNGLCPRRFEPCQLRYMLLPIREVGRENICCLLWGLNPRPPVYETGALPLS